MAGTLFVVATPIGNLEDITLRALRVLREVDVIAAEDTRRTSKLLSHYKIHRPMVSLHAHNEHREAPRLIERMAAGTTVALVSDAGTPGISDPGERLVRLAHERGVKVTPIPGPSAVLAALSVSGLPASEFAFMGFPPRSGQIRQDWFSRVSKEPGTVVVFEAPHRIKRTVAELSKLLAIRQMIVLREATKINEQLAISPIVAREIDVPELGEFVIVLGPPANLPANEHDVRMGLDTALRMIGCMTINGDFAVDESLNLTATALKLESSAVKKAWKQHRISENRRRERLP